MPQFYEVIIPKTVEKQMTLLPKKVYDRVIQKLDLLEKNPRPHGSTKLKGFDEWRIRIGDYRVRYEIHDKNLIVLLVHCKHRKEVYKR